MIPQSSTMPEAKFRTVKKRETDLRSIRTSEFAAELREREPKARPALVQGAIVQDATRAANQPVAPTATQITPVVAIKSDKKTEEAPKKKSKKAEADGFSYVIFWPLAVGIFLSGFAPEWQAIATQAGIWVLRFTFPFALLGAHREIGIDAQMSTVLPQMMVYAQLPIDGFLLMLSQLRSKSLMTAIVQVTVIHALCAFILWLVQTGAR